VTKLCEDRITGIQASVPAKGSIPIDGQTYTQSKLIGIYQQCISTRTALTTVREQEDLALEQRATADAARTAVDDGLQQWAVAQFGATSAQAKSLGYVPRDPAKPSTAVKAAAAAKAKATKAKRGILGKKQREEIPPASSPTPPADQPAVATVPVPPATNGKS
jgi:hypothetical protein